MTTHPLSAATLQRLEQRLRSVDAEPLAGVAPGIDADELAGLSRALPAPLPGELMLWWTWRTWGPGLILPEAQFVTLPACLDQYARRRRWAAEHAPEVKDRWWHPSWFPVLSADGGIVIAADLGQAENDVAPLRRIDWQGFGAPQFAAMIAPSLGDYVNDALDAIDAGRYTYDNRLHIWRHV